MIPTKNQRYPAPKKVSLYREYQPENEDLLGNLHAIQKAIDSIWIPNVHIINDFTDHGKSHSERVLDWATVLLLILWDKTGADLSDVERYLLLASGFLHDIGMQCDIIKFPHIKREAEVLKADFTGVVFDAAFSSNYSNDAQEKIRNNHHLLTAAWIQCAFTNRGENPVSGLDDVAKLIKPSLVQSLKEICMYHSKLPIIETVFEPCKHDRDARIQLIAALLRLADELDIDFRRVPEGVHKNFRLDPGNGRYWWFHERTRIYLDFVSNQGKIIEGIIVFELLLHPDDIKKYGDSVQKMVIDVFKSKCSGLLKILASYSIPLSIEDKLREDSNLEIIPVEILEQITEK